MRVRGDGAGRHYRCLNWVPGERVLIRLMPQLGRRKVALALADQKPLCSPFRDSRERAEKAKAKPSEQLRNWGPVHCLLCPGAAAGEQACWRKVKTESEVSRLPAGRG